MAASATTVDVLAVHGRPFRVVVPAQIGYSRGADGVAPPVCEWACRGESLPCHGLPCAIR